MTNYNAFVRQATGSDMLPFQKEVLIATSRYPKTIVKAPTGSGKSLAFLVALLKAKDDKKWNRALVLSPSRELTFQLAEVFRSMKSGVTNTVCYGGHDFKTEVNELREKPDVVFATPGRFADHLRRESVEGKEFDAFILDEEDKIAELGFQKEIDFITEHLGRLTFVIRVSATAGDMLSGYHTVECKTTLPEDRMSFYRISVEDHDHKALALLSLLVELVKSGKNAVVFFNHREAVDRLADYIEHKGLPVAVYHGGLEQTERERNSILFRNGTANVFFVTDLAARGIDVPGISAVIHYQFPVKEEDFIHRNGRTARMLESGEVYVLETEEELQGKEYLRTIDFVEKQARFEVPAVPEQLWETLYFSLGKKDKVNKVDILGFLTKQVGVDGKAIGRIDTLDQMTFVAVRTSVVDKILKLGRGQKLKKKSVKVSVCK